LLTSATPKLETSLNTKTFAPKTEDWENIRGYFLSTTKDNSGKILLVVTLENPITIIKNIDYDIDLVVTY